MLHSVHDRRAGRALLLLAAALSLWVPRSLPAQEPADADFERFESWLAGPVSVLMTTDELQLARKLVTPEERAEFREAFWDRRDPDPATWRNEFREDFADRLAYVNKEFGDAHSSREGWRTAPGVVYLLLGPPTVVAAPGDPVRPGAETGLVVWTYEGKYLTFKHDQLQVYFIRRPASGLVLAGAPKNFSHPLYQPLRDAGVSLKSALAEAVRTSIRAPELALDNGALSADLAAELPVLAASLHVGDTDGVSGDIALSPRDLYGEPLEGGIVRFRLDLKLHAPAAAAVGTAGGTELVGAIVLDLSEEELAQRAGAPLRVALWLPGERWARDDRSGSGGEAPRLTLTEHLTGRSTVIRIQDDRDAVPQLYAVGKVAGIALLSQGEGLAIAFFGDVAAPGDRVDSSEGLWLSRAAGAPSEAVGWVPAVEGLHMLQRADVAAVTRRD